jgi:hypothetical protein
MKEKEIIAWCSINQVRATAKLLAESAENASRCLEIRNKEEAKKAINAIPGKD